jgi:hypothetical protein
LIKIFKKLKKFFRFQSSGYIKLKAILKNTSGFSL